MDLSLRRVLEALLPGPATAGILTHRYGMTLDESEEALAYAIDQGLARQTGPIAFELTGEGRELAISQLPAELRDRATLIAGDLERRDRSLREHDIR